MSSETLENVTPAPEAESPKGKPKSAKRAKGFVGLPKSINTETLCIMEMFHCARGD